MANSTKITTYLLCIFFLLGADFLYAQCNSNVPQVGGTVTFVWDTSNGLPSPVTISGVKRHYENYILVNVIGGITYSVNSPHIRVCFNQQLLNLSGNNFTPNQSGQVRIYYDGWFNNTTLTISVVSGQNTADSQDVPPAINNKWRTHFYKGTDNTNAPPSSYKYLGYFDLPESFNIKKSSGTFEIYSQESTDVRMFASPDFFLTRALMRSTRKGLYYVNLGADDGTRLKIDNTLVYDNWNNISQPKWNPVNNQIINLSGNSLMFYEFYNGGLPLWYLFEISDSDKIIENTISGEQTLCAGGSNGTPVTGDDFNRRNQYGFTPTFAFQWYYTTSIGGVPTDINGATQKDFTPNPQTAPFNQTGTYYLYRRASVTFKNIGMSQQTESVTSNPIKIIVRNQPTAKTKPSKKSFCQDENNAKIIVTVNNGSGGQPPFTFNYTIDGVAQQIHSNDHIFEIPINTSQAGTFEYKYISIADGNGCINDKLHSTDPITINPLPTAVFSGQDTTLCLNTPAAQIPWVTFTGELPFTVKIKAAKTGNPPIEIDETLAENENSLTINHPPNDEGEFTYELLWVSDKNGCKTFFTNQKVVVNVVKPSITLTTPENITWCLPEIVSAVYDEGSGHTNVSENSYVLPSGDTTLDVTINPVPCCPNPVLKWTINNNLSNVRTGQPSTNTGISFENDTSTDKTYNITYWLECNGQKYNYVTREVRITPRPQINFSN
ncbi:hypothetical protein [Capnocytophaga stomatis]|uniref:hypothetical protein n=1 Tax=Capnocytophaga stomatis TaxID=1848904 RepID=UPI001BB3BD0D|nr:hypothetical protein [Capnocytophaga stomatis]